MPLPHVSPPVRQFARCWPDLSGLTPAGRRGYLPRTEGEQEGTVLEFKTLPLGEAKAGDEEGFEGLASAFYLIDES